MTRVMVARMSLAGLVVVALSASGCCGARSCATRSGGESATDREMAAAGDSETPETALPDFSEIWDFGDPEGTEAAFREILPAAEASGNSTYYWELRTQIARTLGLQRRFEEAHALLDEVEGHLKREKPVVEVRYLLERGRVLNSSGEPGQAWPLFLRAWDAARAAGEDYLAVDAAHMMGIIEPPEESLRWNEKALSYAEASRDEQTRNWRGSLYNNIGWTYHDQGDYGKALNLFEKALGFRREQGDEENIRVARWCVARALRSLERVEEALAIQEELREEHEDLGTGDGYVFEELAECHLLLGDRDTAGHYFARAYAELSQDAWLVENQPDRIARLKSLGEAGD